MADSMNYASPGTSRAGVSLVKVGGALAIAGTVIGTLIFLGGCFGFGAAFILSPIPVVFGAVGLVLAIIGGVMQVPIGVEDTHVLAAILVSLAVLIGGLLEVAIWRGIPIFAGGGGGM
jgi:hypothetical protein